MEAKAGERDRKRRQLLQLAAGAVQQGVAQLQVDKVGDTLQLAQRDHAFGRGGDDQAEELAHVRVALSVVLERRAMVCVRGRSRAV